MILFTTLLTLSVVRISAVVLTNQFIGYSARNAGKENRKKATTFFRFLYITKIQRYFEQKKCLKKIAFSFFHQQHLHNDFFYNFSLQNEPITLWCLINRGVVVITTPQLHSTKPELRFCVVQTLLPACRRSAMVRISDNGPGWK